MLGGDYILITVLLLLLPCHSRSNNKEAKAYLFPALCYLQSRTRLGDLSSDGFYRHIGH